MSDFTEAVEAERRRQVEIGYTAEHDDQHGSQDLVELVEVKLMWVHNALDMRANRPESSEAAKARDYLVEATALLVAAGEALDREEKQS